jgi:hypothetical protein
MKHRLNTDKTRPRRITLSRKKGAKLPPNTVVVARPSRFGNPYRVGIDGDAKTCVELYEYNVTDGLIGDAQSQLTGKNLACWCKQGAPCHADVLLRIAN